MFSRIPRALWLSFLGLGLLIPAARAGTLTSLEPANATVTTGAPNPDILDDFNDGNDRNYWNGNMGTMPDASILRSYDATVFYGASGRSLRLQYNLTAAPWNGFYLKLNFPDTATRNLTGYRAVSFYVRGSVGGVEHLKINFANASADPARRGASLYVDDYLDGGITAAWRLVQIPLAAFANLDSLSNVGEMAFVFEQAYAQNPGSGFSTSGVVYIDDIRFSTISLGSVRADHFGDNWGWGALGGNSGDGASAGATLSHSFSNVSGTYDTTNGDYPWSFQSNYNVSTIGSYAFHFMILGGGADGWTPVNCNLSGYNFLQFRVRSQDDFSSNPVTAKVEIVSSAGTAIRYFTGINSAWGWKSINLLTPQTANDSGVVNTSAIRQINIVYEYNHAVNKAGIVYYDSLSFIP